jgi:hypothetical protein
VEDPHPIGCAMTGEPENGRINEMATVSVRYIVNDVDEAICSTAASWVSKK